MTRVISFKIHFSFEKDDAGNQAYYHPEIESYLQGDKVLSVSICPFEKDGYYIVTYVVG